MSPVSLSLLPFIRTTFGDAWRPPKRQHPPQRHIDETMGWLCRAHDATADDGVSYGYSVRGGWRDSYIETTGYIVCTFYNYAEATENSDYRERATRMAHWLTTVQNADGSFSNPHYAGGKGIVFDTGQDLFGLVRGHVETSDSKLLAAARRAGDWLVDVADAEGRWTRNTHLNVPHVYNSRVAWALLELWALTKNPEYERVARANLDWAVSQQNSHGWFDNCAFSPDVAPFTHTIAYAIRGLWEASQIIADEAWRNAAITGADAMVSRMGRDGFIPGQIAVDGRPAARYCCLTGNAQIAIVWAKLFEATGEQRYRHAAVQACQYVMSAQDIASNDDDIRGAIKGSHPIWGKYSRFTYPNWAAKFFLDALLLTRRWM
ncbi:MAG: hypothetical protein JKY37_07070 [Nannocystaceae bacterium]|nr:hypothetical protein [Nannocystaceae bacterium]